MALLVVWFGSSGCSLQPTGGQAGLKVLFDGDPQFFDPSVQHMGMTVGQVVSREWRNGVTLVTVSLDGSYDSMKRSNLALVVRNGRLQVATLGGYGEMLAPGACINGFVNNASYQWFKITNLVGNITIAADRRAMGLLARSGLSG